MSAPLKYVTLRALVARELVALRPPTGTERRRGARAHARALINAVNEDLDEIDLAHRQREGRLQDSAASVAELALELASFLYAAGATHASWRRWASLSSFGLHIAGDAASALCYAALAGERAYLDILSTDRTPPRQIADFVLSHVIGAVGADALPKATDDVGRAWLSLALSIPGKDHVRTAEALGVLARDWVQMTDGEWTVYAYRAFPLFEPAMCAAAALAARTGFTGAGLGEVERRALEPGLADGWPEPMCPGSWKP